MRKINLETTLKVILIALCLFNIFAAFFPMISLNFTVDEVSRKYSLDGMSLLVNEGKPMYWDMYDAYVLNDVSYDKSPTFISAFSLNVVILVLAAFSMFIKSKINLDKFLFPMLGVLGIVNIICSSMVLYMFDGGIYKFFIDYGLIIFILFAALQFCVILSINFVIFWNKKKSRD